MDPARHLPRTAPVGGGPPAIDELRPGDVDEWGRSEHARELARRLYDPIYRKWFRAEWEGLDKIPTDVQVMHVALINAGAVAIAVLFSVLPALRAALLHPVRALRFE